MKRHVFTGLLAIGALVVSTLVALPGSAFAANSGESVNMYRLYNRISHEHLYTKDAREVNVLTRGDWNYEGTGWVAPGKSSTPVYRLYNPVLGDHHYTLDSNEVKVLTTKHGWKSEGIAWYSSDSKGVAVYRQFNPLLTVGSHNYTTDKNEYDVNNARNGWKPEGVAWYGAGLGNPKAAKPADPKPAKPADPKPAKPADPKPAPTSTGTGTPKSARTGNGNPSYPLTNVQCMPAEEKLVATSNTGDGSTWGFTFTRSGFTKTIKATPGQGYLMPSGNPQTTWSCTYDPIVVKAMPEGADKYKNYTRVGVRYYYANKTIDSLGYLSKVNKIRTDRGLSLFGGNAITSELAAQRAVDYVAGGGTPDVPLSMYHKYGKTAIGEAFYTSSIFDKTNKGNDWYTGNLNNYNNHPAGVEAAYSSALDYWMSHPESDGYKLLTNPKVEALALGIIYLPDTTAAQQMNYGGALYDIGTKSSWGGNQFVVAIIGHTGCMVRGDTSPGCLVNQGWLDPWQLSIRASEDGVAYSWVNPAQTKITSTTLFGQPAYTINATGTKVFQAKGTIWNKAQAMTEHREW